MITYSNYQATINGILPTVYSKADVMIINEKLKKINFKLYLYNHTPNSGILGGHGEKLSVLKRQLLENKRFIIRQLNQQMLEMA